MSHHIDHAEIEREQRELQAWREIHRVARLDEKMQAFEESQENRKRTQISFYMALAAVAGAGFYALAGWSGVALYVTAHLTHIAVDLYKERRDREAMHRRLFGG